MIVLVKMEIIYGRFKIFAANCCEKNTQFNT